MEIKEDFVNYKAYYKKMKIEYAELRDNLAKQKEELQPRITELYNNIKDDVEAYSKVTGIDLNNYEEFTSNRYINGALLRKIKNILLNNFDVYSTIEMKELSEYANKQKEYSDADKKIHHYNKCLSLSLQQYYGLLQTYYFEVHRQMILEGKAYHFEGAIGYILINRCEVRKGRRATDFAKTKKRKEELEAQGIEVYDKAKAEFAKKHGLEYNAVKATVYQTDEAYYEVPLINSYVKDGRKLSFNVPHTIANSIKHKTYEELIESCDNDVNKICNLRVDIRKKAIMCMKVDKTLYRKYIRNENQRSYALTKAYRKNRQ